MIELTEKYSRSYGWTADKNPNDWTPTETVEALMELKTLDDMVEFPDGSLRNGRELLADALNAVGFEVLANNFFVWARHPYLKGGHISNASLEELKQWCAEAVKGKKDLREIVKDAHFWGVVDASRLDGAADSFEDFKAEELNEILQVADEEYSAWETYMDSLKQKGILERDMPDFQYCDYGNFAPGVVVLDRTGRAATPAALISLLSQKLGMEALDAGASYETRNRYTAEVLRLRGLGGKPCSPLNLYEACVDVLEGNITAEEAVSSIVDDLKEAEELSKKPEEKTAAKKKPKSR